MTTPPAVVRYGGLSCYTANLAQYLLAQWDAQEIIARSVRLAVRTDLPGGRLAFSHHATPLSSLPDGTTLRYAAAASGAAAVRAVAVDLAAHGRVIVVTDNAALPWSPSLGSSCSAAPHWLLVDDRRGDEWHVVDRFQGLLRGGSQEPFTGWLAGSQLRSAMSLPPWPPEQRMRNRLAFGYPVPAPAPAAGLRRSTFCWLERVTSSGPPAVLPGRWVTDDAAAFAVLADRLAAAAGARYLDDCWAAAGHRVFAYRWWLARGGYLEPDRRRVEAAIERWRLLPRLLRLAAESAGRGRPRPALLARTFAELSQAEADLPWPAGHAAVAAPSAPLPPGR